MKKLFGLLFCLVAIAAAPDMGLRPASSWVGANILPATSSSMLVTNVVALRNASTTYASGVVVQDSSGLWRGDGSTAGGVLVASPSFNVAATETFARSGAAIDYILGTKVADGVKSTRTVAIPTWLPSPAIAAHRIPVDSTTKTIVGVTSSGAILATDAATGTRPCRIYRSTDGGLTWTTNTFGSSGTSSLAYKLYKITGVTKELLIAYTLEAGSLGFRVSIDDGVTWSSSQSLGNFQPQVIGFSTTLLVESAYGLSLGNCKLLYAPYATRVSTSNPNAGTSGRIYRSVQTISQLESDPNTLTWELVFKYNMAALYATTNGFGLANGNVKISPGTIDGCASSTLTNTGAFTSLTLTAATVEILSGLGIGQTRTVQSHNNDVLTLSAAWTTTPSAGDTYRVVTLNSDGSGLHIHSTCYSSQTASGSTNVLWVACGDGASNGSAHIARIDNTYSLVGINPTNEVAGQCVNWSAASLVWAGRQPTYMAVEGNSIAVPTSDGSPGIGYSFLDSSPYTVTESLWDYDVPSANTHYDYTWDASHSSTSPNIYLYSNNPSVAGTYGGLWQGDPLTVGSALRWTKTVGGSWPTFFTSGSQNTIVAGNTNAASVLAVTPTWSNSTFTFVGDAVANTVTNEDFSVISGSSPGGWSVGGLGSGSLVVTNTGGSYGGGNYWQLTKTVASDATDLTYVMSSGVSTSEVWTLSCAIRCLSGDPNSLTIAEWFYGAGDTFRSSVSASPAKLITNSWQVVTVSGTSPSSDCTAVKVKFRSTSGSAVGVYQFAMPTLIKTGLRFPLGTSSASSLSYSIAGSAYLYNRPAKLTSYVIPFRSSLVTNAITAEVLSVETQSGMRAKLQWINDGVGTSNFVFSTYTSAGTAIATNTLGNITHTMVDPLKITIKDQDGLLSCTVSTLGGDTVTGAQPWSTPWRPKTVTYAQDMWSAGTKFIGWYYHAGVTQQ